MGTKVKIGIVLVALTWALFVIMSFSTFGSIFILGPPTMLAISTVLFLWSLDKEDVNVKKRSIADSCSNMPGLGHLYLGRRKRSIPFFFVAITSIIIFFLCALYPSDTIYLVIITFLTLLYASFMSWIDVGRLCDEMGLPHDDPEKEIHLSQPYHGLYTTTVVASLILISVTLYFWFFDWNADGNIWLYGTMTSVWSMALFVSLVAIRHGMSSGKACR